MSEVRRISAGGAVESRSIVVAAGHGPAEAEAAMTSDGGGSVTRWVGGLKAGDPEATRRLWGRYFADLVRLARARLRDAPRAAADEEDAALSAFDSLCRGAEQGRFPRLDDRADLWRVLVTITARKAADLVRSERRLKRGGGHVRTEADLAAAALEAGGLAQAPARQPSPELAALVADECGRLFDALPDESLRQVAQLRLEGYTDQEIAAKLNCGLSTVERRLRTIRTVWTARG
jgi:DNA-directed RNA polymerase specialized sigma24 family protein